MSQTLKSNTFESAFFILCCRLYLVALVSSFFNTNFKLLSFCISNMFGPLNLLREHWSALQRHLAADQSYSNTINPFRLRSIFIRSVIQFFFTKFAKGKLFIFFIFINWSFITVDVFVVLCRSQFIYFCTIGKNKRLDNTVQAQKYFYKKYRY